jgi:aquaporin Z
LTIAESPSWFRLNRFQSPATVTTTVRCRSCTSLGATDRRSPVGFAGIPIGLRLSLIHLIAIPVDNLSVNPARSTGPALFVHGWALQQLWLFWVAPLIGAAIAGLVYSLLFKEE